MNQVSYGFLSLIIFCSLMTSIQAEENATLSITVVDIFDKNIDNARISVDYIYPQDEDVEIPDQFTKNGKALFSLESEREYRITVTKAGFISYTDAVDLEKDTELTITLEYAQKIPVLHVKRYSIYPQEIKPGEQFRLQVVIENEGTEDALNVKMGITSTQYFSPVQPTSSSYYERLDLGKLISINLTFAVSGETPSGIYDVPLIITYQDAQGTAYTVEETVGISIVRKPLIKLLNVDFPNQVEQGETFSFSVEIANTGRFSVDGMYLGVESDMNWEYYSYYVGTLDAGDFDSFVTDVSSNEPGNHTFTVTIGYVDDFNREYSESYTYSVQIIEKTVEPLPTQQEKGLWARIIEFLKGLLGLN